MAAQPVMLRITFTSSIKLIGRPSRPRPLDQWVVSSVTRRKLLAQGTQRYFADAPKPGDKPKGNIKNSEPAFLPGSQSSSIPVKVPPPPGAVTPAPGATPATPTSKSAIPPSQIPLTPPPPPNQPQSAPPTSTQPTIKGPAPPPASTTSAPSPTLPPPPTKSSNSASPSSPPPPPPPKRRRGRRALLWLTGLLAIFYAGGTFYALESDTFHDFFTEFVPFGEGLVLYFEERQFHSKFPDAARRHMTRDTPAKETGNTVTIPSRSGLQWRVHEESGSDTSHKGPHMSAVDANTAGGKPNQPSTKAEPLDVKAKDDAPKPAPKETPSAAKTETPPHTPAPKADERPPAIAPTTSIDLLKLDHADEPLVQDLVKIVNDLITVVNSDNASSKYSMPLTKAKDALSTVGSKITDLKAAEHAAAEEKIKSAHAEFETSAKELMRRIDEARTEEAQQFRHEFESEKEKINNNYNERMKTELERSQQVAEQKLQNELTEQAIEMKRKFVGEVQQLVEKERDGRLSKLSELSENVDGLQKLTSEWNGIIDSNLATQKLQVAVDAVRSSLEGAEIPRPFVKELAALKEVANGDKIVDAAIASINPTAYQRGIPSSAQLVDRFRRVATEVRKASLLPEDAGIASHAAGLLLSKVLFKKQGLAVGNDVESILTRTETYLEEGNLDDAAREMNMLQGWAKTLSKDWLGDVRRVLEVKQALEIIETEARLQCLSVE